MAVYEHIKLPEVDGKQRLTINRKLLYAIGEGHPLEKQKIFNFYTGKGGTIQLKKSMVANDWDLNRLKQLYEKGAFFTPYSIAKSMVDILQPSNKAYILDMTCGHGALINHFPNQARAFGVEANKENAKVAQHCFPEANIKAVDVQLYMPERKFDHVIINPPFGLTFTYKKKSVKSEHYCCLRAGDMLKEGGFLIALVPTTYLESYGFYKTIRADLEERFSYVCHYKIKGNAFEGVESNYRMSVVVLHKKVEGMPAVVFPAEAHWNGFKIKDGVEYAKEGDSTGFGGTFDAQEIHDTYIQPVKNAIKKYRVRITRDSNTMLAAPTRYNTTTKVLRESHFVKLLYDIKVNPHIKKYLPFAENLVERMLHPPEKLAQQTDEEYQATLVSPMACYKELKAILKLGGGIHKKDGKVLPAKEREGWKTNQYGIKLYKGVDPDKPYRIKVEHDVKTYSIISDIEGHKTFLALLPKKFDGWKNMLHRKARQHEVQKIPMRELEVDPVLRQQVDSIPLICAQKKVPIQLKPKQLDDISRAVTKRYSYISWTMGLGKSLAAYCRTQIGTQKFNIIVGPANAIRGTFIPLFKTNKQQYTYVRKTRTKSVEQLLNEAKVGSTLMVNYEILINHTAEWKAWLDKVGSNVCVIIDEADELGNTTSKRTRAVKLLFQRVRYKLAMSGTPARNNTKETYPMLSWLYNHSYNMINHCRYMYRYKEDKLKQEQNPFFRKPYPAWNAGYRNFGWCHSPEKITVLGIEQDQRDIYNKEEFKGLLQSAILPRTFEEMGGKDKYEIKSHIVNLTTKELDLYNRILREFHDFFKDMYTEMDSRKRNYFKMLAMLTTLRNAANHPELVENGNFNGEPSKYAKMGQMIQSMPNERIALGFLRAETVGKEGQKKGKEGEKYLDHIHAYLAPYIGNRKVFKIDGTVSLKKRLEIIAEMRKPENKDCILLSTIQALKSSLNIDFINQVIVPALPWNLNALRQFYHRFVRLNSQFKTTIHIIVGKGTIDANLMNLLIQKQRLTNFITEGEVLQEDTVMAELGVNFESLDFICKKKDAEGRTYLDKWNPDDKIKIAA